MKYHIDIYCIYRLCIFHGRSFARIDVPVVVLKMDSLFLHVFVCANETTSIGFFVGRGNESCVSIKRCEKTVSQVSIGCYSVELDSKEVNF